MLNGNSVSGRNDVFETGTLTQIWANATGIRHKVGGSTFDWATALVVEDDDLTLPDGTVLKVGQRYIPMGAFIGLIDDAVAPADNGYYGLVDHAATDGREVLERGRVWFTDKVILFEDDMSAHVTLFDGGTVFEARMCIDNDAPTPGFLTEAEINDLFPQLRFVSTTR